MEKNKIKNMVKIITASIFVIVASAFVLSELKIQELEQEIDDQEKLIKNQNILYNINDSLRLQCKTKDFIILRLKLINDGFSQPHN